MSGSFSDNVLASLASSRGTFAERVHQATGLTLAEFDVQFRSKPVSGILQVSIHNECEQKCGHCFQIESTENDSDCATWKAQDVVRILEKFDSKAFRRYPFPREPLLLPDLLPVYEQVGCTEVSTNAMALQKSPELLDSLHKYGIRSLFVSLHGTQSEHCELTGISPHQYDGLIGSLRMVVESGFELEIITALHKGNTGALETLPSLLIDIGVSGWWVQRVMPSGRAREWRLRDLLYGNECLSVMSKYAELKQRYKPDQLHVGLDLSWGPNFYSDRMLQFLAGQVQRWPWSRFACPAVSADITIVSLDSGRVYPCWFLESFPEAQVGRLSKNLSVVLNHQHFTTESLLRRLRGKCERCPYKLYCLGGCRSLAFAFAVMRGEPDPFYAGQDFCLTQAIEKTVKPHLQAEETRENWLDV